MPKRANRPSELRLIQEEDAPAVRTIALVACAKDKASDPDRARDLYRSTLFTLARSWAERNAHAWFILSARHDLVDPEKWLRPYDKTLAGMSREERRLWGLHVADALMPWVGGPTRLVFLAGRAYREPVIAGLGRQAPWPHPLDIEEPLAGLGIGRQMAWLKRELEPSKPGAYGPSPLRPLMREAVADREVRAFTKRVLEDSLPGELSDLDGAARRAFNPDDHVHMQLPSGVMVFGSPDLSPEILRLLDDVMSRAVAEHERKGASNGD